MQVQACVRRRYVGVVKHIEEEKKETGWKRQRRTGKPREESWTNHTAHSPLFILSWPYRILSRFVGNYITELRCCQITDRRYSTGNGDGTERGPFHSAAKYAAEIHQEKNFQEKSSTYTVVPMNEKFSSSYPECRVLITFWLES